MRFIRVGLFSFLATSVSVVLSTFALAAQGSAAADLKEIQAYQLTVPAFKQVMVATRNMVAAMETDPRYQRITKLEAELELEDKDQPTAAESERIEKIVTEMDGIRSSMNIMGNDKSLSEIEAAAAKEPLVANAFKAAGISARDYAKFMGAFFQAAIIQGMQKSGALKQIPKDVNPENLKFVDEHGAEFETFMKELEAFDRKQR